MLLKVVWINEIRITLGIHASSGTPKTSPTTCSSRFCPFFPSARITFDIYSLISPFAPGSFSFLFNLFYPCNVLGNPYRFGGNFLQMLPTNTHLLNIFHVTIRLLRTKISLNFTITNITFFTVQLSPIMNGLSFSWALLGRLIGKFSLELSAKFHFWSCNWNTLWLTCTIFKRGLQGEVFGR